MRETKLYDTRREINFLRVYSFCNRRLGGMGGGVLFKQKVSEGLFINTKLEHWGNDKDKFGGDN